jgi:hypothetical protein
MAWSDRIASARKKLIAAAVLKEHAIHGGLANACDIDQRITHMRGIAGAYLALMTALIGDLNDIVPVTDKVPVEDFQDPVSDAFADASGAFRRVADRMVANCTVTDRTFARRLAARRES